MRSPQNQSSRVAVSRNEGSDIDDRVPDGSHMDGKSHKDDTEGRDKKRQRANKLAGPVEVQLKSTVLHDRDRDSGRHNNSRDHLVDGANDHARKRRRTIEADDHNSGVQEQNAEHRHRKHRGTRVDDCDAGTSKQKEEPICRQRSRSRRLSKQDPPHNQHESNANDATLIQSTQSTEGKRKHRSGPKKDVPIRKQHRHADEACNRVGAEDLEVGAKEDHRAGRNKDKEVRSRVADTDSKVALADGHVADVAAEGLRVPLVVAGALTPAQSEEQGSSQWAIPAAQAPPAATPDEAVPETRSEEQEQPPPCESRLQVLRERLLKAKAMRARGLVNTEGVAQDAETANGDIWLVNAEGTVADTASVATGEPCTALGTSMGAPIDAGVGSSISVFEQMPVAAMVHEGGQARLVGAVAHSSAVRSAVGAVMGLATQDDKHGATSRSKTVVLDRRVVLRGKRESELRAMALQVLDRLKPTEQPLGSFGQQPMEQRVQRA